MKFYLGLYSKELLVFLKGELEKIGEGGVCADKD